MKNARLLLALTAAGLMSAFASLPSWADHNRRPITTLDLLNLRDISYNTVRISPDGKYVAYQIHQAILQRNSYRDAWYLVSTAGGDPIEVGDGGEPPWDDEGEWVQSAPEWSPDSQSIYYIRRDGGNAQVWCSRRDGSASEQITHNVSNVNTFTLNRDGQGVIFSAGPPQAELDAGARRIAENGVLFDRSSNHWAGALKVKVTGKTTTWAYDFATHRERRATNAEEGQLSATEGPAVRFPFVDNAKLSPDGGTIAFSMEPAVLDSSKPGGEILYTMAANQKKAPRQIVPLSSSIGNIWWSADGKRILFAQLTNDGRYVLKQVAAAGGPVSEIGHTHGYLEDCTVDRSVTHAACTQQDITMPPEIVTVDLRSGSLRILTDLNPEFHHIALSPAKRVVWTNNFGDNTFAHIVKPLNYVPGHRYPLIVTTYRSGAFLRGAVGDEYPIQAFAANGFIVLSFDMGEALHLPPFGATHSQPFDKTLLEWVSPMVSLEQEVKTLVDQGLVDPRRTGITGLSHGSEITEFTISHSNAFHAAATSGGGSRDPFFYYLRDKDWTTTFRSWDLSGSPFGAAAANWQRLSPALNAGHVNAPLLIQAASSEYLLNLQLYSELQDHNKPVEMYVYPDELHIKSQPKHRYAIYNRNIDWFNFWLQDKEDRNPMKRAQYRRWEAMKRLWDQKRTRKGT